jgi:hypothetical protein
MELHYQKSECHTFFSLRKLLTSLTQVSGSGTTPRFTLPIRLIPYSLTPEVSNIDEHCPVPEAELWAE